MSLFEKHRAAAALHYDPDLGAPSVIASARGALVQELLEIAENHKVPILRNPVLAEALSLQPAGSFIPESLFRAAAEVYLYCSSIDEKVSEKLNRSKEGGDE